MNVITWSNTALLFNPYTAVYNNHLIPCLANAVKLRLVGGFIKITDKLRVVNVCVVEIREVLSDTDHFTTGG